VPELSLIELCSPIPKEKIEQLNLKLLLLEENAVEQLPAVRKRLMLGNRVMLVADETTYQVAGETVAKVLADDGITVHAEILKGENGKRLHATVEHAQHLVAQSKRNDDAWVIGVGSGTINDTAKYTATLVKKPHIAFPTAPSMDGYTSSVAALIEHGVKHSFAATPAVAVVADPNILKDAPLELIQTGFADIVAKFTSCPDWILGYHLTNDLLFPENVAMVERTTRECVKLGNALKQRDAEAIRVLVKTQMASGLAMVLAGSSRPASGSEHLLSHCWEMLALSEHREPSLHGLQVGVGTVIMSGVYEKLWSQARPSTANHIPLSEQWQRYMANRAAALKYLGSNENEVGKAFNTPEELDTEQRRLRDAWDLLKEKTAPWLLPATEIKTLLRSIGAERTFEDIGITKRVAVDTLHRARFLRSRYTVLDIADTLGLIGEFAEEVCEAVD
jgi:glycerol-1-phosphate dehydrogenase [NAD(P)+]